MKKIISLLLVLVMVTALFAACGENGSGSTEPSETVDTTAEALANAKAYIKGVYKDSEGTLTRQDYTVVSVVSIGSATYDIEWTIEVTAGDASSVAVTDDGTVATIQILNPKPTEEVQYNLVGTITAENGQSVSVSFSHYIGAVEPDASATVAVPQTSVTAGVAYKWGMYQANLDQTLYFAGTVANKDYYLTTTDDINQATDVYLEEVEGGYHLYFYDAEGTKMYIDIFKSGDYVNLGLTTEPTAALTWDTEYNTLAATIEEGQYYIGTYKEYNTLSCSSLSYAATSFPATMYAVEQKAVTTTVVTAPAAETAYKWGMYQANLDQNLYFAGTVANKDYYLTTTDDINQATDVYLEEVEGGYHLYFYDAEGTKMYIDMFKNGDYFNLGLTTEPTAALTWSTEYNTLVATIEEGQYYIGTYNTYNTLSCSSLSYAATSFPTNLITVAIGE